MYFPDGSGAIWKQNKTKQEFHLSPLHNATNNLFLIFYKLSYTLTQNSQEILVSMAIMAKLQLSFQCGPKMTWEAIESYLLFLDILSCCIFYKEKNVLQRLSYNNILVANTVATQQEVEFLSHTLKILPSLEQPFWTQHPKHNWVANDEKLASSLRSGPPRWISTLRRPLQLE